MVYRATTRRLSKYDDFDLIAPRLAQGAYPEPPSEAFMHFDVVVFCAKELQPRNVKHHSNQVAVFCPMDDDPYRPIDQKSAQVIHGLSRKLSSYIQSGKSVLVTCAQGMNRSGLITGLTMVYLGWSGVDAVQTIRAKRRQSDGMTALFNPIFAQYVIASRRTA